MRNVWFMVLLTVLVSGCSNFYQYQYVENMDSQKGEKTFSEDMSICKEKASNISEPPEGSGGEHQQKQLDTYQECMIEKGWRLK